MNLTRTPKPDRQHRSSRSILAAAAASVILGATFAAYAGTASAETITAKVTSASTPMSAGAWPSLAQMSAGPWPSSTPMSAGPWASGPWSSAPWRSSPSFQASLILMA